MIARQYATPLAFKQALEQRLRSASATGADFARRRQLLVFDRFLARLAQVAGDAVTLKGGLVLELRLARARTTKDVDLRMMGSSGDVLDRLLGPRVSAEDASRRFYGALARNGLLRSYLLKAGEVPCAFVVGHEHGGVFHYAELGFDSALASLSPGTVLLFLLIQDLTSVRPVKVLNFGMGDAVYKRRFSNRQQNDESFLLFDPGVRVRALVAAHRVFRRVVVLGRRFLKPRHAEESEG